MHTPVIPVPQPRFDIVFLLLALGLEIVQKQADLLAERSQRFPPVGAAVLVFVADEDLVQQLLDVA